MSDTETEPPAPENQPANEPAFAEQPPAREVHVGKVLPRDIEGPRAASDSDEAGQSELQVDPSRLEPLVPYAEAGAPYLVPPAPRPRLIPNLGHAAIFFLLTVFMLFAADLVAMVLAKPLHLVHGSKSRDLTHALASEPLFIVFTEGLAYALSVGLAIVIFTPWWKRPFSEGIHWNAARALRRSPWLITGGIALGVVITLAGNFLPMPKSPPIMQDMMRSQSGAWMMLIFGVTVAPLFEELAFRGFLLPSIENIFLWLARRGAMTPGTARAIGIPLAVIFTSIPFAMMHAQQLSSAWAPVFLIGIVSVALCAVRLALDSVMASALVHASYNLMLFGSILVQTSGFRHLEKLSG
jgi:membrane protease YdiL (CAAX protease family)